MQHNPASAFPGEIQEDPRADPESELFGPLRKRKRGQPQAKKRRKTTTKQQPAKPAVVCSDNVPVIDLDSDHGRASDQPVDGTSSESEVEVLGAAVTL